MTPQQLKGSIIQLAIQGKLVPNCQDELIAERYLQELQSQKHYFLPKRETKKKPASATIDPDEIPFAIPRSWAWTRLEWCCTKIVDGDHNPPPGKREPTPYLMLSAQNINQDSIVNLDKCRYLDKETFEKVNERTRASSGDILLTAVGTLGRTCIFDGSLNVCFQRSVTVITTLLYNKYLKLYLDSPFVLNYMISHSSATAQKGFYINKLQRLVCPIPPLEEQKRIVEKIESLMPLVDEYERLWNELESLNRCFPSDLEKSILQLAFGGKLVKQLREEGDAATLYETILKTKCANKQNSNPPAIESEEVPFEIPQSWKWVRWGDLAESIQYGYNAPAKTKGRIKMVRISDIHDDSVDWPNVPWCDIPESDVASYLLKKNDILFARTGGTVGKAFLVRDDPEPSVYAGYLIRTRYNSELIDPEFLRYFMDSSLYWRQLRDGTIATAQPNCNGKTLSKMMLPLPPLGEQHRIVAELNNVFSILKGLHHGSEEKK